MRIAACFYGIDRSLRYTYESILTNVLNPVKSIGELKIFAHFFKQFTINNQRSEEENIKIEPAWDVLSSDSLTLEEPDTFIRPELLNLIMSYGDVYGDSGRSIRNLMHQLHSIRQAWNSAIEFNPDVVIFLRPDLIYHDNFIEQVKRAKQFASPAIYTPNWQQWLGGLNDRFAICNGSEAANAYATRISLIQEYCALNALEKDSPKGLHSERLLYYAVLRSESFHHSTFLKASRVRATGYVVTEDFKDIQSSRAKQKIFWHNMRCQKRQMTRSLSALFLKHEV
jgi:hypothetical protein